MLVYFVSKSKKCSKAFLCKQKCKCHAQEMNVPHRVGKVEHFSYTILIGLLYRITAWENWYSNSHLEVFLASAESTFVQRAKVNYSISQAQDARSWFIKSEGQPPKTNWFWREKYCTDVLLSLQLVKRKINCRTESRIKNGHKIECI